MIEVIIVRTKKPETWHSLKKYGVEIGRVCAELTNTHFRSWLLKGGFVLPEYRRQGVFSELWAARLAFVMAHNPRTILGWCWSANRPLFLADGFVEVERDGNETLMSKVIK